MSSLDIDAESSDTFSLLNAICNRLCGIDMYACDESDQESDPSKFKTTARENSLEGKLYEEKPRRDFEYCIMQLQLRKPGV